MRPFDFANRGNAEYIDQLYAQYQQDPSSVDQRWRDFFTGFDIAGGRSPGVAPAAPAAGETPPHERVIALGVFDLVHSYRELGHFEATIDPLGAIRPPNPLLNLSEFNMSEADLDRQVGAGAFNGPTDGTLRDLVAKLRDTYCRNVGVEFTSIANKQQRDWLTARMEPTLNDPTPSREEAKSILFQLIAAEEFEQFLHTRYVGAKRFSLEGGEALIPLLNTIIDSGAPMGVENYCLGMAHRGRLSVLAHIMNKPYEVILSEFEKTLVADNEGDGDVKYHLGYSNIRQFADGREAKLSLSPNPSHLELVNPVVEGIVRAKQTYLGDRERTRVVPVLIHGDAAFVGQGVVHETLGLSELPGYRTGGTIHVIVNNQIGFTTAPEQTRFTPYPTDAAKMIQAPVFHVNGDDPEAVVHAAKLAIGFREQFKCDVFIDLWCYRRHGHNETDEPTFTQPAMYRKISQHPTVRTIYGRQLIERGIVTEAEIEQMRKEVVARLEEARARAKEVKPRNRLPSFAGVWRGFGKAAGQDWNIKSSVDHDSLKRIADAVVKLPPGFQAHPKVARLYAQRREAIVSGKGIDWGTGEMLAMGTLLLEGMPVRFTGQDVERGTFSHRHALLRDYESGIPYVPLNHLSPNQPALLDIHNSLLSEEACLGFEWGFACADPRNLVIWEAQFGDFVNGAQAIIDQFIAAAESKWQQSNGLVLMLPHGYEGAGPEHSNAYMERFLSLCAEENMQVVVPTTPAQVFHALRRQQLRMFRKPLVMFMPKSMLRYEPSFSRIEEFTDVSFQNVIDEPTADHAKIRRLCLCTGKVYYSLIAAREKAGRNDIAVVRVEQLYPFPRVELQKVLGRYRNVQDVLWVQEEPQNRGAYSFMDRRVRDLLPHPLSYVGREEAASPAVGMEKVHAAEEAELLAAALDLPATKASPKDTAKQTPATAPAKQTVSD